jgi:hypothetical protein
MKELARLAIKAKSETARVAAIRELLDRGYGKTAQIQAAENDADLSDLTAEELRTELLADFAAAFPNLRIVPATLPNSLAKPKEALKPTRQFKDGITSCFGSRRNSTF